MTVIQEFFDELAFGEFANIITGNKLTGEILPELYPRVLSAMNVGLRDIYSRLDVSKSVGELQQTTGVTEYILDFDRMVKVLWATDSEGKAVRINDAGFPDDLFMPAFNKVTLKDTNKPRLFRFTYQALHPRLVADEDFDPSVYTVEFPSFVNNALLNYVASRWLVGKGTKATEVINVQSTFKYQYEVEMDKIVNDGHIPVYADSVTAFTNGGWE